MAKEHDAFDVDANYRTTQPAHLDAAKVTLHQAKNRLDFALRGTRYKSNRTLISTSYNLLREVEDLLDLVKKEN
jgi:hypothetical protein